jgi:Skp family chaperone for outer membrane proteins
MSSSSSDDLAGWRRLRLSHRARVRFAVAVALAAIAATAPAALYKWTDANGRVVYSDQPPPASANTTAEVLRSPLPPANPNAVKEMAAKEMELKKRMTDRIEEPKKTKAEADWCAQVRGQVRLLSSDDAVYRANEKGERVYLDADAKRKEIERLETLARERNCPRVADAR